MANPRPTPTALKVARGNPGKRKLPADEPKPSRELPPCPEEFPPVAKAVWERVAPELFRLGVLTVLDLNTFKRYCLNYHFWQEATNKLLTVGPDNTATNASTGEVTVLQPNNYGRRARDYEALLLKFEQEFGMTPSSRTKIKGDGPTQGNVVEEQLSQMKLAE